MIPLPLLFCPLLALTPAALAAPFSTAADSAVLIPAGTTTQGQAGLNDAPPRQATLTAFRIDRTEVSLAAYKTFAASGAYSQPELWSEEGRAWLREHPDGAGAELRQSGRTDDHPVVAVTWFEADAYCRAAGGSLPTEAQWERAACGDGERRFPWGDSEEGQNVPWYSGGKFGHITTIRTIPVTQEDPSAAGPYGVRNAAGNVWEWTADRYRRDSWAAGEDAVDPHNQGTSPWRTLRGGSFMNLPSYCTCAHREPARPDRVAFTTGFRCAYPTR